MEPQQFIVREATGADLEAVTSLFRETILNINAMDYAPEQTNIWSAAWQNREQWLTRIRNQHFLLAFSPGGELAGFGSVEKSGFLDMLYTGKDFQRKGVAKVLIDELENFVRQQNAKEISAEVSITGRPFFERIGFITKKENRKILGGVEFINFLMCKDLQ